MSHNTKKAEEEITQISKETEWNAEIYQNRYTEINEGRKKKASENHSKVKEIKQIVKDKIKKVEKEQINGKKKWIS